MNNSALILIDLQNDFMPGGALAVNNGDTVVTIANKLQMMFSVVIATQDWHPANHGSFASNHPDHHCGDIIILAGLPQVLWPTHCVQDTTGADFVKNLELSDRIKIIRKGTNPIIDSYSGFFDNGWKQETKLRRYLQSLRINTLYIMGLATDYCVKSTVIDACKLGFKTYVIEDGCKGVNLQPNDSIQAFIAMRQAGAIIIHSDYLIKAAA